MLQEDDHLKIKVNNWVGKNGTWWKNICMESLSYSLFRIFMTVNCKYKDHTNVCSLLYFSAIKSGFSMCHHNITWDDKD